MAADLPRIRGEHVPIALIATAFAGSSPHTRGARLRITECLFRHRIIPAYAGSTQRRQAPSGRHEDHPRIRGEHMCRAMGITEKNGSSPHTRGAHLQEFAVGDPRRIIPAYAGSTGRPLGPPAPGMDHPRIRGEHASGHLKSVGELGSSPHTRGARLLGGLGDALAGIIPAYAGSTKLRDVISTFPPDHPRIRGEHPGVARAGRVADGSSPHTRGARFK